MMIDALGKEIIIGQWYGYSAGGGGWSHTTLGKLKSCNESNGNVRLTECRVNRYLYGEASDYRADVKPRDVSIRGIMIFPVPPQDQIISE